MVKCEYILVEREEQDKKLLDKCTEKEILKNIVESIACNEIEIELISGDNKIGRCIIGDIEIWFSIKIYPNSVNWYFDIKKEENDKIIYAFEILKKKIKTENGFINKNYYIINSYDPVSLYYCDKLSLKFNSFERNLRLLFQKTYVMHNGNIYYEKVLDDKSYGDILSKGNLTVKKKPDKSKELRVTNFFEEVTYFYIEEILFTEKWTKYESDALDKVIEKYNSNEDDDFIGDDENLNFLKKSNRDALIQELKPKTDWERYFSGKMYILNPKESFSKLRNYRNKVAHNKTIFKEEYEEILALLESINNEIIRAIDITNTQEPLIIANPEIDSLLVPLSYYFSNPENYFEFDEDYLRGR